MSTLSLLLLFFFFFFFLLSLSSSTPCDEHCGHLRLPFPFHLNSSCGPPIPSFHLTCNSTTSSLYLPLGPTPDLFRVLSFLPSSGSLLLDYSSSSSPSSSPCDRRYSGLTSLFDNRSTTPFFSLTPRNVLRLYDCEDSSVCRTSCPSADAEGCEGNRGCCYGLADGSVWKVGDGFGVFAEFGCRGVSSWVVRNEDDNVGIVGKVVRGIEMEWGVPRGLGNGTECAGEGAVEVNATAVRGGVRCTCGPGFVGDGYAAGTGCFKSCNDDGNTSYSEDCCKGRLCRKKVVVVVGLLVSIFFISAATACYFLLRRPPNNPYRWGLDQACLPKIFAKACRTRHFTYQELNQATKGFDQHQKLLDIVDGTIHPGVLCDGSLVAVQRMRYETPQKLKFVLDRVELLSQISHKNIARIIGCCISSGHTLLVHEFFPFETLKKLLQPGRENGGLSWYRRINIATEIASALAHLQSEITLPIKPHNLESSDIFILPDYSVKIACFKLLVSHDADVASNFSHILLELILGSDQCDGVEDLVLTKIKDRRFSDIVDPCLRFGDQLPTQCEQMERLAVFAVHCMSRKGLCMVGVAKEFVRIVNDEMNGTVSNEPLLEVTFSNSSLLQMISVSPDSLHVL